MNCEHNPRMQDCHKQPEPLSIQESVSLMNDIAQALFLDFEELRDTHRQVQTMSKLFNDDTTDRLEQVQIDILMMEISKFYLRFSHSHLVSVVRLKEFEFLLESKNVSRIDRQRSLDEVSRLLRGYSNYSEQMDQIKRTFNRLSSVFLFPQRSNP